MLLISWLKSKILEADCAVIAVVGAAVANGASEHFSFRQSLEMNSCSRLLLNSKLQNAATAKTDEFTSVSL